jgi:hypothetical protein
MSQLLSFVSFLTEDESITATADRTIKFVEAFGVVVIILIVFLGIVYLRNLIQITELDNKAKNAGGHIDTLIWDLNFNKNKIIPILEEAGVKISAETKKEPMLSLGMSPATQLYNYNLMKEAEKTLRDLIDNNPSLKNEELDTLLNKYKEIYTELIPATDKYNKAVKVYNDYISHFPANIIADHKSKNKRNPFIYNTEESE